jgi:DNA-binding NtrC family response regulator
MPPISLEEVKQPDRDGELRPQRVLLVEDHLDTLRVFARMLRREGFQVEEAQTFSKAAAAAKAGDFLVSDIALPDGNGCDLMRSLSAVGIPGIAISGFGSAKDKEEYKRAGFAEFFVKPVDVKQIIGAIARVMGGQNVEQLRS